ncbi:protein CBFA2T2-like isoform X1 [Chiloscyllium plagiosum]|uniref:protein CBFA2T2-like isoform X1 n=2 Tax=Chiloscyllium plagiosum TaxID=36176 RepID=UPI001CB7C161|nr:protein CBFA2T2-like isoform X1 [Chiloscyllium plagiosum]
MVGISGSYQVNGEKTRSAMPGSPVDVKVQSRATPPTMPPPPPSGNQGNSRPNSFTPTSLPNGVDHSPPALNGVPSPPQRFSNGPSSSLASQQLPATCGARQLSKLKRFLTTLQQFGNDISPEIGERVRSLVLALVNSTVTIEEFHSKLQEATNFPLRPFVIPFLKANLPLLQRELLHCARSAKQTPAQYLAQHEHLLLNANATSPVNSTDLLEVNENGKRNSPERNKENGFDRDPPAKRVCTISPAQRHSPNIGIPHPANGQLHPTPPPLQHYSLDDVAINHLYRDPQRLPEYRDRHRHHGGSRAVYQEEMIDHRLTDREWAEEWKHLDHLLNCIMDMVEKTRRSLAVLCRCQEADREELNYWMRRYNDTEDVRKGGSTHLRQLSPGNTDTIQTELNREIGHRPSAGYVPDEIWKKAEEAVNEVKRQAVSQLQKAVTEAEQKAYEMITAERAKMEQKIADAKRQAAEDAFTVINEQEDTSESCWNCGRKASETCSGCNAARYCGSFCQHKDWEKHHRICGQNLHAQAKVVPAGGSGPKAAKGEKSPALEKAPPSTVTSRSATPAAPDASVQ